MKRLEAFAIGILIVALAMPYAAAETIARATDGTSGDIGQCLLDATTSKAFVSQLPCRIVTRPSGAVVEECPGDTATQTKSDFGVSDPTLTTLPPLAQSSTGALSETITSTNTGTVTNTGTSTITDTLTATVTGTGTYAPVTVTSSTSQTATDSSGSVGAGQRSSTWTQTSASTATRTVTATSTGTDVYLFGRTVTLTATITTTLTATSTGTWSGSATIVGTVTTTAGTTATAAATASTSGTASASTTSSATATWTASATGSSTSSFSGTETYTVTGTGTGTKTLSNTILLPHYGTETFTASSTSAGVSSTVTATTTATATGTLTGSGTWSVTGTTTSTSTSTGTTTGSSTNAAVGKVNDNPTVSVAVGGADNAILKKTAGGGIGGTGIVESGASLQPITDGDIALGAFAKRWKTMYVRDFVIVNDGGGNTVTLSGGHLTVSDYISAVGNIYASGFVSASNITYTGHALIDLEKPMAPCGPGQALTNTSDTTTTCVDIGGGATLNRPVNVCSVGEVLTSYTPGVSTCVSNGSGGTIACAGGSCTTYYIPMFTNATSIANSPLIVSGNDVSVVGKIYASNIKTSPAANVVPTSDASGTLNSWVTHASGDMAAFAGVGWLQQDAGGNRGWSIPTADQVGALDVNKRPYGTMATGPMGSTTLNSGWTTVAYLNPGGAFGFSATGSVVVYCAMGSAGNTGAFAKLVFNGSQIGTWAEEDWTIGDNLIRHTLTVTAAAGTVSGSPILSLQVSSTTAPGSSCSVDASTATLGATIFPAP